MAKAVAVNKRKHINSYPFMNTNHIPRCQKYNVKHDFTTILLHDKKITLISSTYEVSDAQSILWFVVRVSKWGMVVENSGQL